MKRRALIWALVLCLLLQGCSGGMVFGDDSREIDQLELVETLGIDAASGGLVTVTAATDSAGEPVLLKTSGVTVSRAVREMQNFTAKKYIFYGHTSHILVGEEAARRNLNRCLEYLERDSDVRLNTKLCVVQGGTAETAIRAVTAEGESAGDLLASLERDVQLLSESYVFTVGEIAQQLARRNCALVAAVMLESAENILDAETPLTIQSTGYGVIQGEKLRGFLDTNLARGVNLLIDQVGSDVVEAPDGAGGWFAARLTGGKATFRPEFENGTLKRVSIEVELHCNLDEVQEPHDLYDEEVIRTLEAGIEAVEAWRIREVLERMQEWNCDFCDLQTRVRQAAPWRFDRMPVPWELLFPELDFQVTVNAALERTYDVGLSPLGDWEGDRDA